MSNKPTHMLPTDLQLNNEYRYSKKHIDKYIATAIAEDSGMQSKVLHGVVLLNEWLGKSYYPTKDARLDQIRNMDIEALVRSVFVGVAYCQVQELFVSVTAQLAVRLNFDDKRDSIMTIAEIVGVLCRTDAFDINKESRQASLYIQSLIPLPTALMECVWRSQYLPPMVSEPEDLTSNYHSPCLTFNDSLLLGKQNAHDGDICLDVINTQNQIPLRLSVAFLKAYEEKPTHELDTLIKCQEWDRFRNTSNKTYLLMLQQGNRFYLTNKPDTRGRLYAQGYHITTQGVPFKKAMIELADKQLIHGVPQ
jgi:hypothetical protein